MVCHDTAREPRGDGLPRRAFLKTAVAASVASACGCTATTAPGRTRPGSSSAGIPMPPTSCDHFLGAAPTHNRWNRDLAPRLTVRSGETVTVQTREASDGHFNPASTSADVATRDRGRVHPLTGPIWVQGAAPGDVLQVDIIGYELPDWGWTCISPPAGFLGDEIGESYLHIWNFDHHSQTAQLKPGIQVAIDRPFLGVIGLAWNEPGEFRTIPPRAQGGNMDIRYLTAGTSLYLPVDLPGAMLSVGDGHAAQGDGEVCVSAIECDLTAHLRLTVRKDLSIAEPQYETADLYATTGIGTSIEQAAKKATRAMIAHLTTMHALTQAEAYVLCSVAMDLNICETVDMPHYLVSAHLPRAVLAS